VEATTIAYQCRMVNQALGTHMTPAEIAATLPAETIAILIAHQESP